MDKAKKRPPPKLPRAESAASLPTPINVKKSVMMSSETSVRAPRERLRLPHIPLRGDACNLRLELVKALHLLLPRLTRRKRVARALDGDSVVGVLDHDRWEGLVALAGADARGCRGGLGVRRAVGPTTALAEGVADLELLVSGERRGISRDGGGEGNVAFGEEGEPWVAAGEVVRVVHRGDVEVVEVVGRLVVLGGRRQVGEDG